MTIRRAVTATSALFVATLLMAPVPTGAQDDDASEPILGKRSSIAFDPAEDETITVSAGTRLHVEPGHEAPVLATVRANRELPVLRRDGDWTEVRYDSWLGWVFGGPAGSPEQESLLDRPGWVIESAEDGGRRFAEAPVFSPQLTAARLERLRELLGEGERVLEFGPYTLYSDVANDNLIVKLAATASVLEATYQTRFGLGLRDAKPQAVVLFARETTYRSYEQEVPELSALATLGHQSHGVAVTFVGNRSVAQIRRILLHELTHLLNRRALPLVLPSWLEEGLAEDLSFSRVDQRGRIRAGTVLGVNQQTLTRSRISGGFASLATLLRHYRLPGWPKVTTLVDANWEEFVQPTARPAYYTQAAFFIRFLVDGREGRLAEGFRSYLHQVAEDGSEPVDLWASLGVPKDEIEKAYDVWIWSQGQAYGVTAGRR